MQLRIIPIIAFLTASALLADVGASVTTGLRRRPRTLEDNRCEVLRLEYDPSDLVDTKIPNVGKTQYVPLHAEGELKDESPVGLFTLAITDLWINDVNACLFVGSLNLDPTDDGENSYESQINVQGSCAVETNAVVGGTGKYRNAVGTQTFEKNSDGAIVVIVDYCTGAY